MSELIEMKNGQLQVPDNPQIPYLQGDGIGPEIWQATQPVLDAAVKRAYQGRRKIDWLPLLAGERAHELVDEWLPQQTIMELKRHLVAIKGPMTTPVGTGHRSINVALRQTLDLYACWRPIRYFAGVPSPVRYPERVCIDLFRENTEDIYAGIEASADSKAAQSLKKWLQETDQLQRVRFPDTAAFGIKPISKEGSQRLIQSAVDYALKNHRHYLTLVHKGNIMKETEGGFKKWGYQLIEQKYANRVLPMPRLEKIKKEQGEAVAQQVLQQAQAQGMLIVNDIICDNFFQQALLFPEHFDVVATMNLNGDYLSDALSAQVGGLGIAPGSNINFQTGCAIFEATHGTAPQLAGKNCANPTSLILSGAMMMEYLGWGKAAEMIRKAVAQAIAMQKATPDLVPAAAALSTSQYGELLVKLINS